MESTLHLADNLRWLRQEHDLTQDQLAQILDLKRNTITAYESQRSLPPLPILIRLAGYFQVSIDHLLFWDYKADAPIDDTPAASERETLRQHYEALQIAYLRQEIHCRQEIIRLKEELQQLKGDL
ncbi:MAG: helix-turn-helix transcriptional regulator [Bernardetiaceae bacterium]